MSTTYDGDETNDPDLITIPSDGDALDASSVNVAFEALMDKIEFTQAHMIGDNQVSSGTILDPEDFDDDNYSDDGISVADNGLWNDTGISRTITVAADDNVVLAMVYGALANDAAKDILLRVAHVESGNVSIPILAAGTGAQNFVPVALQWMFTCNAGTNTFQLESLVESGSTNGEVAQGTVLSLLTFGVVT